MPESVEVVLLEPVQFGSERIEKLTITANGKAMQGLKIESTGDGGSRFEPYAFARAGMQMAAQPFAVLDLMHPSDLMRVATVVMGFISGGLGTGIAPTR